MKNHLLLMGLCVAALVHVAPVHTQSLAPVAPAAIADYEAKLAIYERIHGAHEAQAAAYWDAIGEKRRLRNEKRRNHLPIALDDYVLTQPPIYSGPPRPIDPRNPDRPPPERPEIPVVADFLKNAAVRPSGESRATRPPPSGRAGLCRQERARGAENRRTPKTARRRQ